MTNKVNEVPAPIQVAPAIQRMAATIGELTAIIEVLRDEIAKRDAVINEMKRPEKEED